MYLIGSINVKTNNPSLQLLAWNLNFYRKKRPLAFINNNENYKGFYGGITTQCFDNKDPECSANIITTQDKAINITDVPAFMDSMTQPLRAAVPVEYIAKPKGVTNFYLSRVGVNDKYKTGIAFINE